jgi:EmrB/QacA subfamily drug resistance transporter
MGAFMSALDSNIVTIALPKIAIDQSAGISQAGWVVTGYVLASAALLLQTGKIGDRYGRKNIYLLGFGLFGFASVLCGLSQSIEQLIAFRVLQGVAAAMLTATTSPLIFDTFPPEQRGTAIGVIGTTWAVGAVAGPAIGGFLVSIDWRLIFYINVPIAALAVIIGAKKIPRQQRQQSGSSFNPFGSLLLGLTVAMVLLWLTSYNAFFATIGLITLASLVISERTSKNPLIDKELRRNRGFVYSALAVGISQLSYLGVPFALSFYFQLVAGYSALLAGLFIAPLSVALVISNPLSGRLFDKLRYPAMISLAGLLIDGVFTIILGLAVERQASSLYLSILLVLIGIGNGMVWTPLIGSALKFAGSELRGLANGTSLTLVNICFAASIAITVTLSASFLPQSVASNIYLKNLADLTPLQAGLFNQGIAMALLVLGVVNFILIPLFIMVLREQRRSF